MHEFTNLNFFQFAVLLLLAANPIVLILFRTRHRAKEANESKERTDADPDILSAAVSRATTFLRQRLRSGDYAMSCRNGDGAPRFHHGTGHVFVAYFISEAMLGLLDEIDRTIMLV